MIIFIGDTHGVWTYHVEQILDLQDKGLDNVYPVNWKNCVKIKKSFNKIIFHKLRCIFCYKKNNSYYIYRWHKRFEYCHF